MKALLKMGICGVTISDVRGFGSQGGSTERHGGSKFSEENFVAKVRMEIAVSKDQVEAVVDKIIEEARFSMNMEKKLKGWKEDGRTYLQLWDLVLSCHMLRRQV